jgi:hypothetical protein
MKHLFIYSFRKKIDQKSDLSWLYPIINIYVELFKPRSGKTALRSYDQHIKYAYGDKDRERRGEGRKRREIH